MDFMGIENHEIKYLVMNRFSIDLYTKLVKTTKSVIHKNTFFSQSPKILKPTKSPLIFF